MRSPARRLRLAAAVAAALLAGAGELRAQVVPGPGLTLEEVVRSALQESAEIEIQRRQVEIASGEVMSAGGVFDAQFGTSVSASQQAQRPVTQTGEVSGQEVELNNAAYAFGLTKQFRSGVRLQPTVSVSRSDLVEWAGATSRANVDLTLVAPLLRDRGGVVMGAQERMARAGYDADLLTLRHATAMGLLEAVSAYWGYRAAAERLEVYASSEARAERLAADTRVLVEADERPASDLNQLLANVASKRVARIAAEQAVVEARRRLGIAMGLPGSRISALARPADPFPPALPFSADSAAIDRLEAIARARRADLAAAARLQEGAAQLLLAARNDLRSQLDLSLTVGYTGVETGPAGDFFTRGSLGEYVAPLFRNTSPGAHTSVQLQYKLPLANAAARGRAVQRQALLEQQRIAERDLQRRISSGVAVAAEAVQRSALSLAESEQSVELYRRTVENEKTKFQLGAATLFDVVLAEDGLTSSLLGVVNSRLGHALAVVTLRFETGALVSGEGSVAMEALVTPP